MYAVVPRNGRIPHRWLGRAWNRFDRDESVYVVMPFNRIASALLGAWWSVRSPDLSAREMYLERAYWRGYGEGYAAAQAEREASC